MTIYFELGGAKVDNAFVQIADTSVPVSEIISLFETEHQPGWEWPVSWFVSAILSLIVWLSAPIENSPIGILGATLLAICWYSIKSLKPKQYWLTVKGGSVMSFVVFKSEEKGQVQRFRKAIESAMERSGAAAKVSASVPAVEEKP